MEPAVERYVFRGTSVQVLRVAEPWTRTAQLRRRLTLPRDPGIARKGLVTGVREKGVNRRSQRVRPRFRLAGGDAAADPQTRRELRAAQTPAMTQEWVRRGTLELPPLRIRVLDHAPSHVVTTRIDANLFHAWQRMVSANEQSHKQFWHAYAGEESGCDRA